jgi:hypothetical protein
MDHGALRGMTTRLKIASRFSPAVVRGTRDLLLANEALTPQVLPPRHAGMGAWSVNELSGQTIEMQRGGTRHLLQVSFRLADRATASEANHSHPLGECALNASTLRIELATGPARQRGPHAINGFLL